jgi:hypothetical protein
VVVGVPLALSQAGSTSELFGTIIVEIPIIWLVTATVFGLHKRRLSAWQLNWLCLLGDVIGFSSARVGKATAGEKAATFAASLILYGLVWGIPNYIYFKKRRVLFSGPPLVEDGIRGVFKAIWRFIWPSVASLDSATRASREGFYAAAIMTLLTLILVSFSALGYPLFGIDVWSLLDASISAAIAWGIYRLSRTASVVGIFFFIVEQVVSWTTGTPGSVPEFIGHALTTSVLAFMFINGARGTFAYRRHQKAAADESHGPAVTSSVRWKIYSAVLTSFVLGVIALRVYQSLINVAPTGNTGGSSEDLTALVKQVRPAVVTIATYDSKGKSIGQGSGFFTSKDGEILTNHHVLKGAYSATVKTSDGKTHPVAAVLADDPDSDLTKVVVIVDDDME